MRGRPGRGRRSRGPAPTRPSRRRARTRSRASRRPVDALPHRRQPEAGPALVGRGRDLETDTVVSHVERHDVPHVGQCQPGARGVGVLGHVGQGLLRGSQQRDLDLGVQRLHVAGGHHLDRHAIERRPVPGDLGQGLRQSRGLEVLGPRALDRSPRLGQALAREADRVPDVSLPGFGPVAGLLGRLELGDDSRSGPGRSCRGSRVPSVAARRSRRPRGPGSAAGHATRRSPRVRFRAGPRPGDVARSPLPCARRGCRHRRSRASG